MSSEETAPVTVRVDMAPDGEWCMSTGPRHAAHVKVIIGGSVWLWCVADWRPARSVLMERGHPIAYGNGAAQHIVQIAGSPAGQDATAVELRPDPCPAGGSTPGGG